MTVHSHSRAFLNDPNFLALRSHYVDHPMVLYTGAGVSWARDAKFGMRGWDDFVRSALERNVAAQSNALSQYDDLVAAGETEPWELADWVVGKIGRRKFAGAVVAMAQAEANYQGKWRQLSGKFLSSAHTLKAIAAFCARLTGVVEDTDPPAYRVSTNPRIRAILTSNYDCFLEAGSSTMYINPILKPVGAIGSTAGDLDEIPVFHIHGYVPFPARHNRKHQEPRQAFVDPVITTEDYASAWRTDDVYCQTMGPQIHYLRFYSVFFIGFSFRDEWVRCLLRRLNGERARRSKRLFHYAIVSDDEVARRGLGFYEDLGVRPIALGNYDQVPALLGEIYQAGLTADHHERPVKLRRYAKRRMKDELPGRRQRSPNRYWRALLACRNRVARP